MLLECTGIIYSFLLRPFCRSLAWHLCDIISLPVSAAVLLFSLKTLRSLNDGILGLNKVLLKSKLDVNKPN